MASICHCQWSIIFRNHECGVNAMKKIKNCGKSVKKVLIVKTGLKVGECGMCVRGLKMCDGKIPMPC